MVFTSDPHRNYLLVQISSSGKKELSRGQQAFVSVSILNGFLLPYFLAVCVATVAPRNADLTFLHFSKSSWFIV